jgi:hypothetical protein
MFLCDITDTVIPSRLPVRYLVALQATNRLLICYQKGLVVQPSPENQLKT